MLKIISNLKLVFLIFALCKISFEANAQEEVLSCDCGVQHDFTARIVGGRKAAVGQYPWMAAIMVKKSLLCGGSLINDRYILTAGHCTQVDRVSDLLVYVGMNALTDETTRLTYAVKEMIVHERFKPMPTYDIHDIALLKLNDTVPFSPIVTPICLAKGDDLYEGYEVIVAGWGRVSESGSLSNNLYETMLTIIPYDICRANKEVGLKITTTVLCAYQDNADACMGDSGGPLMFKTENGVTEQIGVVSWGIGCARRDIPGVYTRVNAYYDWIRSNTKDAKYCSSS